jgi:large subunit ribosomal protein L15
MAQEIGLHNLKPKPGSRHRKKRVGRGEGSGLGKTAGRGEKGAGARSGDKTRVNFEGGQMPIHMRLRKLRGPHMKKSMPFEQFGRTHTQPVNLRDLEARFDAGAEITPEALREKGLATRKGVPVKVLAQGELTKKLTVRVHAASRAARAKIEEAGGTLELLVEPRKPARERAPAAAGPAPEDLADQEQVNEEIASDAEVQRPEQE